MLKITVIIPVYNAEAVLARCIESVLNQTYKNFELILINDGSTDNSLEIINKYKEKDERIKVINNNNNGVSETRNIGIASAKGEYIQFIDADDYIEDNMLEQNLKIVQSQNSDLVITGAYIDINNNGETKSSIQTYEYEELIGKKDIALGVAKRLDGAYIHSLWNKIYKRDIIINNNIRMIKEISLGEDLIFNLEYLKYCNKVVFNDKCYYHYCMDSQESLTAKYRQDKLQLMRLLYDKCDEYLKYCNSGNEEKIMLNNVFIKWMYSCFIDLHSSNCKLTLNEKIQYVKNALEINCNIINNTSKLGLKLNVLKKTLRYPIIVILVSKIIFIIKTTSRHILYK